MSGANNGYQYLKTLPFVDNTRLGIFGHSTGALNAIRVAKANPDHRAVNGQSSNGGEMDGLHNYLLTQGLYEEIGGYREKTYPVKNLVHNAARLQAFGLPADLVHNAARLQAFGLPADSTLEWNHTYGKIADGSARRADLVQGSHLGVMIATATNQSAIDWFAQTLGQPQEAQGFTYWYKESSGLVALIAAVLSTLCLAALLLDTPYFAAARQPLTAKAGYSPSSTSCSPCCSTRSSPAGAVPTNPSPPSCPRCRWKWVTASSPGSSSAPP